MSLFTFFRSLRTSLSSARRTQLRASARVRPSLEFLENRNLLSVINWVNKGTSVNDSDGFNAVFGDQAFTARQVVEAAIHGWQSVIENFNYADGSNTFAMTVKMSDPTNPDGANTGAATGVTKVDANHKPMAATMELGRGDDGKGGGYFLDLTPFESSEFQGKVINAYAANATPGGPANALTDLFTVVTHEMSHAMGILGDPNLEFIRDPHHYLQDAHQADAAFPGKLWTYTGPDVIALLTTDNSGVDSGDLPLHTADPNAGNVVVANGRTYYGSQDSGNAFWEFGRRYLVSNLDALILKDSYGYTIHAPGFNNMYMIFDQNARSLLIRGGSAGENIYPGQSDPSNDAILLTTVGNPEFGFSDYEVFVNIGNPAPGTSSQRVFTSTFPLGVTSITIDAGDGANTISMDGVAVTTSVHVRGSGPDVVNVTCGYAQDISGPILVTNLLSTTRLVLDASAYQVARNVTVNNTSVVGLAPATISFNGRVSSLTIFGGSGGNTFTVPGTLANTHVTLNTGRGGDIVTVGNATDGLGSIASSSPLTVNGAAGYTALLLDDRANTFGTGYEVHSNSVTRSFGFHQVSYSGISSLFLSAGSGSNTILVLDTPATMATRINAGPAGDSVQAGSPFGNGLNILGPLTVNGQGGNTRFLIFDQGATTGQTYTLTDTKLTRSGGLDATFSGLQSLSVNGGSGNNVFAVAVAPPSLPVTLNGGSGVNTLIGPDAAAAWNVQGAGAGSLGTNISFSAMTNLAGGNVSDTFTFAAAGSIAGTLAGGDGADSVNLAALAGPVTVNLQTGAAPPIHGGAAGGFSAIESWIGTASAADTLIGLNGNKTWNISSSDGGTVATVAGNLTVDTIGFAGFENLTGGAGVDVFRFTGSGALRGNLSGGGAPLRQGNWLDYTALTVPVSVNLQSGAATRVAGRVNNIQNVHGGNGGNTLTGNAQGNILIGGTGADIITGGTAPSVLIGDTGADVVTGGSGGDILVGGTTIYDMMSTANQNALMAILAEWQSVDSYEDRFRFINTGNAGIIFGGGLNGSAKLNMGTTVSDDGAANVLTAHSSTQAIDWFFAGTSDTLQNLQAGEHVNNNTPAKFRDRTVTSPINEGDEAILSGTITDPDSRDRFILEVNWGDGTPTETFKFPPGSDGKRVSVAHRYRNDGAYTIALSWHDPVGPANSAALVVVVNNVSPLVKAGDDDSVKAGQMFERKGFFIDPGADTWTATVDYGDGSGPQPLDLKDKHFHLQHKYQQAGTYRVVVTVRAADGSVGSASFEVRVR